MAGMPQGSILGPMLLLVFINDIVEEINSSIRLLADDTSLNIVVNDPLGFGWLVLLLYVPSQQLWSLRDGQFT